MDADVKELEGGVSDAPGVREQEQAVQHGWRSSFRAPELAIRDKIWGTTGEEGELVLN
jgi:hypothetical protein